MLINKWVYSRDERLTKTLKPGSFNPRQLFLIHTKVEGVAVAVAVAVVIESRCGSRASEPKRNVNTHRTNEL